MRKLTDRQEKFCKEFAASGNAYQSAIAAGYSENYARSRASFLLENVGVKKRLAELYKKHDEDLIASGKELKQLLTEIVRQSRTEEVVVTEGLGEGCSSATIIEKHASIRDQLKAIELLARMGGMFSDKVDIGIKPIVLMGYEDVED